MLCDGQNLIDVKLPVQAISTQQTFSKQQLLPSGPSLGRCRYQTKSQRVELNCSIFSRNDLSLPFRDPSHRLTHDALLLSQIFHFDQLAPFPSLVYEVAGGIFEKNVASGIRQICIWISCDIMRTSYALKDWIKPNTQRHLSMCWYSFTPIFFSFPSLFHVPQRHLSETFILKQVSFYYHKKVPWLRGVL